MSHFFLVLFLVLWYFFIPTVTSLRQGHYHLLPRLGLLGLKCSPSTLLQHRLDGAFQITDIINSSSWFKNLQWLSHTLSKSSQSWSTRPCLNLADLLAKCPLDFCYHNSHHTPSELSYQCLPC